MTLTKRSMNRMVSVQEIPGTGVQYGHPVSTPMANP